MFLIVSRPRSSRSVRCEAAPWTSFLYRLASAAAVLVEGKISRRTHYTPELSSFRCAELPTQIGPGTAKLARIYIT